LARGVRARSWIALTGVVCAALAAPAACRRQPDYTFASPEEAIQRLGELLGTDRVPEEVLGPGSRALVSSGDERADREDGLHVKALIEQRMHLADYGENARIALLGNDDWPLPFPLVQSNGRWRFDVEGGAEELLNRRVGRNELLVLETLREIVNAQREYFAQAIGSTQAYAIKLNSTPGFKDGLYWPAGPGEAASPLGPFVAQASIGDRDPRAAPEPFRGYYFRIVTGQGPTAPGGAHSYFGPGGSMVRGFGVVAWPAKYGSSGVMTFQVNESGIVFQKDLGRRTVQIASGITAYSPDSTWDPTPD
jgi:hypothetical protein